MKYFDYLSQRRSHVLLIAFLVAVIFGFAGPETSVQDWTKPLTRMELEIWSPPASLGDTTTMRILLEGDMEGYSFERFSFTITYDTAALTFIGGSMGAFVDSCGWEAQHLLEPSNGVIQIFAHAALDGTPETPTCFLDTRDVILAELDFEVTTDTAYDCTSTVLRFFWEDCNSNVYWSASSDTIYLSDEVSDWDLNFGYWRINQDDSLPTIHGAPDSCASSGSGKPRNRMMDFYAGHVDFICTGSIDLRGDLNLNNVPNEIADLVLFTHYFLLGIDVFEINQEVQVHNSDVNADSSVLRVSDIIYLMRIVVGDANPFPKSQGEKALKAHILQDDVAKTITVEYPDTLAGLYLVFSNSIEPEFVEQWEHIYTFAHHHIGGKTNVLLLFEPYDKPESFDSMLLFSYSGEGVLKYAEVGDFRNRYVETVIHSRLPIDLDGIIMLLGYIFSGNYVPEPLESGDVNCDGIVDIDDVVYLLEYIFAGGPEPYIDCP